MSTKFLRSGIYDLAPCSFLHLLCPLAIALQSAAFFVSGERNRTVEAVEMVAEVSSLARMVDTYKEEGEGKTELVTLDLLGGCGDGDAATAVAAAEVNLDLQIRASGDMCLAASVRLVVHTPPPPNPPRFLSHELAVR